MSFYRAIFIAIGALFLRSFAAVSIEKLNNYAKFNATKRPLNLYITTNGKHATIANRTFDLLRVVDNAKAIEAPLSSLNASKIRMPPKLNEFIAYRVSRPPFAIKRRGSVILLHNATGNSLSWHEGYPSLMQMLAASGHTTVGVELIQGGAREINANAKLVKQIIGAERLSNITFIAADANGEEILEKLLLNDNHLLPVDDGGEGGKALKQQKIEKNDTVSSSAPAADGVILLNGAKKLEKWQKASATKSGRNFVPILLVRYEENEAQNFAKTQDDSAQKSEMSAIKVVQLSTQNAIDASASSAVADSTGEKLRLRLMQIFANYLDFIHPR